MIAARSLEASAGPEGPRKPRQVFSTAEDQKLIELVTFLGGSDWSAIAQQMPGRNARQCRDRWKGYLSPTISTGAWTPEEDDLLMQKWHAVGPRWSLIATTLNGRSEVSVRNRLQLLCRRQNRHLGASDSLPSSPSRSEDTNSTQPEITKWPSIPMPESTRPVLSTQRELEAFFDSLGPVPAQKPRVSIFP
jgi:hypothetical protein